MKVTAEQETFDNGGMPGTRWIAEAQTEVVNCACYGASELAAIQASIDAVDAYLHDELSDQGTSEAIARFFQFKHLKPGAGRDMSRRFALLAILVLRHAPRSAERAAGLRKLLEGKDCAVRAVLS